MSDGHNSTFGGLLRNVGRKRDIPLALDVRREKEADIREVEVVRYEGPSSVVVKNVGGTVEYRVTPHSRVTLAPGSKALALSNTGHPGETLLPGAPVTHGGSTSYVTSPTRMDFPTPMPEAPPAASYFGVFDLGGSFLVARYNDAGAYVDDVGTQTVSGASPGTGNPGHQILLIETDAGGFVADNSIAWWKLGEITVLQPAVGADSFSVLTPGWKASGFGFVAGWFYWIEHETTPHSGSTTTWRLRKCRADGSGATTVGTLDYTPNLDHDGHGLPAFDHWKTGTSAIYGFHITPTACVAIGNWTEAGDSVTVYVICRFTLAGTGSIDDFDTDRGGQARPTRITLPYVDGSLFYDTVDGTLSMAADSILAAEVALWPGSGSWANAGHSIDIEGSDAILYDHDEGALIRNAFASAGADPDVSLAIEAHPTVLDVPGWMFVIPS